MFNSQKIDELCQRISTTKSTDEFQRILNDFLVQLDRLAAGEEKSTIFNKIFTVLFSISPNFLVSIVQHAFFVRLRTNFIRILKLWIQTATLNDVENFYFWNFNKFLRIFIKKTSNFDALRNGLANGKLLKLVATILKKISESKKLSESFELKLLTNFLRNLSKIQKVESNRIEAFGVLLGPTVKCLTSSHVFDSFVELSKTSRRSNSKENLFLVQMPNFLSTYRGSRRSTIFNEFLSKILLRYENLFDQIVATKNRWSKSMSRALRQTFVLFRHACENSPENIRLFGQNLNLIEEILKLVRSSTPNETKILNSILDFLVLLLNEPTIVERIQQENMSEVFLQFEKSSNRILAENSRTILASIVREDEMKNMTNQSDLLVNVISSMKDIVERKTSSQQSTERVVETLKSLVQHDQMKEEILKQNFIPFLLQNVDKLKDRPLILLFETLWSLSFFSDAAKVLRADENFLAQIKKMSEKTHDEALQKVIEGLTWKLIQEPAMLERRNSKLAENQKQKVTASETIIDENGEKKVVTKVVETNPEERTFEYDMMISYCHADKEIVYKIHEFLLEQGFKIWIDLNHMHGPAMSAMADAVENSEFVLLCMSISYKKSTYCQAEAEYAFGCKRRLIPLIVRPNYRADGWLGFLIGSRIYVDFGFFDFPTACEKLMNEIRLQRQQALPSKVAQATQQHTVPSKNDVTPEPKKSQIPDQYAQRKPKFDFQQRAVARWTEFDVLDFLVHKQLIELMPLCEKMDGKALLQLYKMCSSQHNRTYTILNDELKDKHKTTLPISAYTRFLSALESLRQPMPQPIVMPTVPEVSYRPYDILVTSNASTDQMLSMVQKMLPQLSYYR